MKTFRSQTSVDTNLGHGGYRSKKVSRLDIRRAEYILRGDLKFDQHTTNFSPDMGYSLENCQLSAFTLKNLS